MVDRTIRYDRAAPFAITDAAPTFAIGSAAWSPEGYLDVDAYIARDGLLQYSDGKTSWAEYRPRAELASAAASWTSQPVTDDHPKTMVDSKSWATVARGTHTDRPTVEGPFSGVSYLRARLRVTDEALLQKVRDGVRQVSIGFTSRVIPLEGGAHEDGTRAAFVQTDMRGNHSAILETGRAGEAVRLLMDGAAVEIERPMPNKTKKQDAEAAPSAGVPILAPDGTQIMVPAWLAEQLAAAAEVLAAEQAPGQDPAPAPAPAPAAPAPAPAPPDAAQPPAPPAPPAPAPEPEEDAMDPDKKKEESKDSIRAIVRARVKLERMAADAGVPATSTDAKVLTLDSEDIELQRAIVAKRMPWVRTDDATAIVLSTLVEAAASMPEPKPASSPNWTKPASQKTDGASSIESEFLKEQGY